MTEVSACETGSSGLGRVAYEAESAWLDEIAPGRHTPWDALDPEVREVYQRLAGTVAAAERERIAAALKARADALASEAAVLRNRPGQERRGATMADVAAGWAEAARCAAEPAP